MPFPFNAYLPAFLGSFFATLISLPLWRKWCLRVGLVDDPGHRKIHDQPTALAGGLAVMTGLAVPLLLGMVVLWWINGASPNHGSSLKPLDSQTVAPLEHGLHRRQIELAGILIGALGMLVVGVLDDKHELRPRLKFAGQLLVAFIVAACGARITLFVHNLWFSYAVTMLWILTVINAF